MTVYCIDVETIPTQNAAVIAQLKTAVENAEPPKNLAKEKKRDWHLYESIANRIDSAIRKTSVDTLVAEPIVIDLYNGRRHFTAFPESPDYYALEVMEQFKTIWREHVEPGDTITGHNIKNFDFRVLASAFQRARLEPPATFPRFNGRYYRAPVTIADTLEMVGGRAIGGAVSRSLASVGAVHGIEAKSVQWRGEAMTGARVYDAFLAGEIDLLVEYCRDDTDVEFALYDLLTFDGAWTDPPPADAYGALESSLAEIDNAAVSARVKWETAREALRSFGLLRQAN